MMRLTSALLLAVALTGCTPMKVQMMGRTGGSIHTGSLDPSGGGGGSMTVVVDGKTCTGPAQRVGSNDQFGISTMYGASGTRTFSGSGTTYIEGDTFVKALLQCEGGGALRCDLTGRSGGGGGICADNNNRVYDVLFSR